MAESVKAALYGAVMGGISRHAAEWLMAHALGVSRSDMLLKHSSDPAPDSFATMVSRRLAGEPLAYIIGNAPFMGLELAVTPDVLIPRADSETLIIAAQTHFNGRNAAPSRILDLGTGSGALLLAALDIWQEAAGIGSDQSSTALAIARHNGGQLGFGNRVQWIKADWADGITGQFDLILCNPPYIAPDDPDLAADVRDHEPHSALFAGDDGLAAYRRIIPAIPRLLAAHGIAIFEIGHRQAQQVMALAEGCAMEAALHHDLADRPRAVAMTTSLQAAE